MATPLGVDNGLGAESVSPLVRNWDTITHDKGQTTTALCVKVDPVHMKRVVHKYHANSHEEGLPPYVTVAKSLENMKSHMQT